MNYKANMKTIEEINKAIEDLEDMIQTLQFNIGDIPTGCALDDLISAEENMYESWIDFYDHVSDINDLQEMTGQESGIIMFPEGSPAGFFLIANWSHDEGIPFLSPLGEPFHMDVGAWHIEEEIYVENVYELIKGKECAYDRNADVELLATNPTGGTLYILSNKIQIIAPDGWN